jgi:WD40 repeat protein
MMLASASWDKTINVWNLNNLSEPLLECKLIGHLHFIYDLIYLPKLNGLASASQDNTIAIWKLNKCNK